MSRVFLVYQSAEGAVEMLTYICEVMWIVQSKRIDLSPYIAINGDGSTDLGKQHQFTIDIRTIDPTTNETHTEFLQLSNCAATARAMTLAFVRALGTSRLATLSCSRILKEPSSDRLCVSSRTWTSQ